MALEPENERMDELLKSAARKRRDEAVEPFTMHPVTRKMLQDEVARVYESVSSRNKGWWASLIRSWPRLGFAAAVLLALLGVMLAILPNQQRSQELARRGAVKTDTELAQPSGDAAPKLGRSEAYAVRDNSGNHVFFEAKKEATARELDKAGASVLSDRKQKGQEMEGVTLAAKDQPAGPPLKPENVQPERSESLTRLATGQLKSAEANVELRMADEGPTGQAASAPVPPGIPPSNGVFLGSEVSLQSKSYSFAEGVARTRFAQAPGQQPAVAGGAVTNAPQSVLASFDFEQTGDQVRITDADGSVYQGRVLEESAPAERSASRLGLEPQATQAGKKLSAGGRAMQLPQVQQRAFRASGTNRTLQKAVMIEANLSVPTQTSTSAPAANAPAGAVSGSAVASQTNVDRYRRSQAGPIIEGRAQIGTNPVFQIQAVPARQ